MDLYGYYTPARLFLGGENPYDRRTFTAAVDEVHGQMAIHADGYACPLLPSALVTLGPLALFSFERAARLMWLLNFGALLFSLWAMAKLWTDDWTFAERICLAALLAQSRLIDSIAYRGQPSLIVLAAILAALLAKRRGASVLAGAWLVLALSKFTLALPLLAFWIWDREWRALAWAAVIGAGATLPALLVVKPSRLIHGWLDSVAFIERYNRLDASPFHLTNWSAIYLRWLAVDSPLVAPLSAALLVVGATGVRWALHGALPTRGRSWKFAALTALGIVSLYHRVYDAVVLFPLVFLAYDALRVRHSCLRLTGACLAGALGLLVFVLSPQSVALRTATWMARHSVVAVFSPVNAWLAILIFTFTLLLARQSEPPIR